MPRRIPDFPDAYAGWNSVASFGSYLSAISGAFFFYVLFVTFTQGERVGSNYWKDIFEAEASKK